MDTAATAPPVPNPARRRLREPERQDGVAAGVGAVAALLVFLVVRRSLIDDAFITLSYARNVAEHFHWGLTGFRTANTATSPLNVLVLGLGTFLTRDAVRGLGLVFVVLNALQAWGLSRLARRLAISQVAAFAAFFLVLLSPLMLSIVGMEMTLGVTLLVWLTVAAAEARPVLFGLMSAALVLTRLDLVLFPLVLLVTSAALLRRIVPVLAVAVVAVLPWYLFSWLALGGFLPDTLVIKTIAATSWGPWHFGNGPMLYLDHYPEATVLSILPAAIGGSWLLCWILGALFRLPSWRGLGPLAALATGGAVHYLAYTALAPAPFHWYYAPAAASLTIAGALGFGRFATQVGTSRGPRLVLRAVAGALAATLVVIDGRVVLNRPLPWIEVPVTTNWATSAQYEQMGKALHGILAGRAVGSPGEIGALAYYCRCDIRDLFSDRTLLVPLIQRLEQGHGGLVQWMIRLNFAHRDRQEKSPPPTLRIVYRAGPTAPGRWPVDSAWRGHGAFDLVPR